MGVLVVWLYVTPYMAIWHVRGAPPPLKVGVSSLVLNAFSIVLFDSILSQNKIKLCFRANMSFLEGERKSLYTSVPFIHPTYKLDPM